VRLVYTPEQEALRDELRAYFHGLLPPEVASQIHFGESGGEMYRKVIRQMGTDGWLGIGWPKEYGGQGRSPVDQFIFFDEALRAGAPVPLVTLNTVGPTLMVFGTDEQKERFLPAILRGECHFSIGYTEPGAGTDLASLRTRAVRDGDEYIVNGNKVFTTGAHDSDFIWLACRTDPDVPKHKGISILLVDTKLPGYKVTPIITVADGRTNAIYFDDVRVPASMLVGGENNGWKMITTQLNHERVALSPPGRIEGRARAVRKWAQETRLPDGRRVIDQEWVQVALARVHAKLEANRLMSLQVVSEMEHGQVNPADASSVKVYGSEVSIEIYGLLSQVLGAQGSLQEGSPAVLVKGDIEKSCRQALVNTFGGGVNEVQREIIAMTGLGMPRPIR
jgi:alkylation response protein AidB-like acyl-CoA dehydrogenase